MLQKLTKHGRFCKQNNQLPTKSHDELKDNSIEAWQRGQHLEREWWEVVIQYHLEIIGKHLSP